MNRASTFDATRPADGAAERWPLVSLIMPVRNESQFIARSLGAVLAQRYPADRLEILVADGMSTDDTRAVVEALAEADARGNAGAASRVRIVDNPERIVPTGMNRAMALARGDVVVRVDGHCEVPPEYVARAVELLDREGVAGVGGPVETVGSSTTARAISLAMSSAFGVGGGSFRTAQAREREADTVPFPAYRRQVVAAAGPYDEELVRNQDDEYNYRLRKLGWKLVLSPSLTSRYHGRATFRGLARQYAGYGYWKVRVLQKHPRQMRSRQFVPPLACAAALLLTLLAPTTAAARNVLVLACAAYAGVATLAALKAVGRHGMRLWPGVVMAYALMHASYGLGFLVGLWSFRGRWATRGATSPAGAAPLAHGAPT